MTRKESECWCWRLGTYRAKGMQCCMLKWKKKEDGYKFSEMKIAAGCGISDQLISEWNNAVKGVLKSSAGMKCEIFALSFHRASFVKTRAVRRGRQPFSLPPCQEQHCSDHRAVGTPNWSDTEKSHKLSPPPHSTRSAACLTALHWLIRIQLTCTSLWKKENK